MNTTNTYPGNTTSTFADRAHQAVDKAAEQVPPVVERASTAAHQTIDKVANAAAPAAQWATENGRQLATKSNELAEMWSGYIRARPLATLAGAITIGYLAGRMLR